MPTSWTNGTTEARLKAVYETGEFRAKGFSANWWPDSKGYSVRQRDSETGERVTVHYDVRTGEETEAKPLGRGKPSRGRLVSPDGKLKLEVRGDGLSVEDLGSGESTLLLEKDTDRAVSFRNPKWSPDGKFIAFTEADNSKVRKRSMLVPDDPSYPGVREQQFARVGEKITTLRVGIVDVNGQNQRWLPLDSPEEGFYLGTVEWAPNSNELLVERLSRFRDKREFFLASTDGELKRIFHETDPAWVVASQARNSGLTWIEDGQTFIVISEKDGWRHAWRYSRDGETSQLLTPGDYDIIEKAVVDEDGGWYYFYASPENATERYLHRVPLDRSGGLQRVTPKDQPGTHAYDFSPDAKWAFHTFSTLDTPPVTELVELAGHRVVKNLEDNRELRERAKTVFSRPAEFIQLPIDDGVVADAWMIKPTDFDETKKYPVFVYVYGEPHLQTVLNQWGAAQNHFHRVIADLGYIVVSIDNRGTPAPKGAAWRRSIAGSLGPLSTEDQAAALKELARTRPYVDLSRVGIWGWSGGGSNTLNALFRKPDDYHVGIAVVPKPQPHLYNAWFQEIYMNTREANPDGYKKSAPLNFAEGLKGKLLIVTGSGETNTHIQIIEGLVDRLIELGKQFDYMVYPNRDHGLSEGVGTVVHVRMLITRYLLEHLPPGPRSIDETDKAIGMDKAVNAADDTAVSAKELPSLTFCAAADCQYCDQPTRGKRVYRNGPKHLQACVDHCNKTEGLSYMVHLGDFIDAKFESFARLNPITRELKIPLHHVLGNHDFDVADQKKAEVAATLGLDSRYYFFRYQNWRFIALDGNDISHHGWAKDTPEYAQSQAAIKANGWDQKPNWNGAIGESQMRWLEQQLVAADAAKENVILYCHFPVWPVDEGHDLWNAEEVMSLIEPHQCVKAYINGHNHNGNYAQKNGIHYLTLKGMVENEETTFANIRLEEDVIVVKGFGAETDRTLKIR
nr:DPP IV N-terminal domain-containing protein [Mariniblastus fucicola]